MIVSGLSFHLVGIYRLASTNEIGHFNKKSKLMVLFPWILTTKKDMPFLSLLHLRKVQKSAITPQPCFEPCAKMMSLLDSARQNSFISHKCPELNRPEETSSLDKFVDAS